VLKLVAQGSGNKWIASELRRSIKTIDHHRENIMKKLGIHEVAGLTLHALAIGLL
jgi:DNA-binding NarL/FixJ family response regulator